MPLVAVLAGISFKLALACCRAQIHLAFIGTAIVAATAATIALIAIKKPNKISSQEETVMTAG
jgi:hypothetical protein